MSDKTEEKITVQESEQLTEQPKEVTEPAEKTDKTELNNAVVEALKSVYDPEIPVNIYELGLIYSVNIDDAGKVEIEMTLTSPACPVAGTLPPEVEGKVRSIPGVSECVVKVVWDPPWGMNMMSEEAKLQLNLY
ncbi:MAG TPA: SUF system Fe-S cluster assembly protein [Ignavibacteria bacterium]|nr:SUF system Fe-S cluster assembly protein [Ignavibacteria bacterium]HMQ98443.1 SUF system Fe-S cluster assembly protein [Ignavibacteria bacterium]